MVAVERLEQAVPQREVVQAVAQLDERQPDAPCVQLDVEGLEHLGCGDVHVGDRLALQDDPARLALAHERTDLPAEDARVREEQRGLPPVDEDAGDLFRLRVGLDVVPAAEALHAPYVAPADREPEPERPERVPRPPRRWVLTGPAEDEGVVSYEGGDGNDLSITFPPTFRWDGGGANDNMTLAASLLYGTCTWL